MAYLDALDTAILRELQADARRTNRDLAAAVGVAPTTALDRTRSRSERVRSRAVVGATPTAAARSRLVRRASACSARRIAVSSASKYAMYER